MTKADLIAVIADRLRLPSARAEPLVDTIFDSLVQSLLCAKTL
jgi:nucleoid DNA-binding protein